MGEERGFLAAPGEWGEYMEGAARRDFKYHGELAFVPFLGRQVSAALSYKCTCVKPCLSQLWTSR